MAKVTLNKTVKIKGKGMILAGVEIDVTAEEKKELEKAGHIGESKRSPSPTNEKEIQALVAEVAALKAEIVTLKEEIETLSTADLLNPDPKKA